jgi:hypothetical protein
MYVTGEWRVVPNAYGIRNQPEIGTMLWIRISTGELCIEVNDNEEMGPSRLPWAILGPSISRVHLTSDTNLEDKLLSNMSLDDIHRIFSTIGWDHWIEFSDPGTILLGSISWPRASYAHLFNPFSKFSLSDSLGLPDVRVQGWKCSQMGSSFPNEGLITLPNGWTRYDSPSFSL